MFPEIGYGYMPLAVIALALMFWRPVAALVFLTAIFPMDVTSPRLGVPGVNTETILLLAALAVTVLRYGARLPPLRFSAPVVAFVVVIGIGFVLSIPWARKITIVGNEPALWVTFKQWKSMTFSALFFFATYWWFQRPQDRTHLLEALSVGTFVSGVVALVDLWVLKATEGASFGRATGLQGDPNGTACAIGAMMFASLYLVFWNRELGWFRRAFHGGTYALSFVVVVLSQSRGNYIGLVVSHLFFFLLMSRTLFFGGVVTVALFATVAFPLLPEVVRDRIEYTVSGRGAGYRLAGAEYLEGSTAQRLVLIRTGIDMFQTSPLWGRGLNFFFFRTPEFSARYGSLEQRDSHNLFIKIGVEMGLIGLGALFWLWGAVFWCGWSLWRSDAVDYRLGAVMLAASLHVLVASFTTNSFLTTSQISSYFWIMYAMAARAYVSRAAVSAAVPAASPAMAGRWRRFSQRASAAASQL